MTDPTNAADVICVRCQACGFIGPLNDFDVMGADPEKLFCNRCGRETQVDEVGNISLGLQLVTAAEESK